MAMTAGLSYNTASEPIAELKRKSGNHASTREMVGAIAMMPLLYEPGTRHAYSLGHDVIAAVIEVVTGQRFGDYVVEHVFKPLGVSDVFFHLRRRRSQCYGGRLVRAAGRFGLRRRGSKRSPNPFRGKHRSHSNAAAKRRTAG